MLQLDNDPVSDHVQRREKSFQREKRHLLLVFPRHCCKTKTLIFFSFLIHSLLRPVIFAVSFSYLLDCFVVFFITAITTYYQKKSRQVGRLLSLLLNSIEIAKDKNVTELWEPWLLLMCFYNYWIIYILRGNVKSLSPFIFKFLNETVWNCQKHSRNCTIISTLAI